jgi:hypothetical protein
MINRSGGCKALNLTCHFNPGSDFPMSKKAPIRPQVGTRFRSGPPVPLTDADHDALVQAFEGYMEDYSSVLATMP